MRSLSARRPTSTQTKRSVPPACSISRTSASPAAPCVPARTKRAPSRAKRSALARPMPLAAPVMPAALPASRPSAVGTQALPRGAEPVDAELDLISGHEVARRAVAQSYAGRRAGGDDVAREERHELADVADECRHVEEELARRAALFGLAVHLEPDREIVHVANLVRSGEAGAQRRERDRDPVPPPLADGPELQMTHRG